MGEGVAVRSFSVRDARAFPWLGQGSVLEGRGSVRLLSLPQQLLLDRVGAALGAAGSDRRLAVLALQALSPVNLAQGWTAGF